MKWPEPLLIIILLPLYFLSCDSKSYPHVLQLADSLANTCPESAIALLEQFKDSASQESKETQMYYQLLTIKARDKAYITHTSDTYRKHTIMPDGYIGIWEMHRRRWIISSKLLMHQVLA